MGRLIVFALLPNKEGRLIVFAPFLIIPLSSSLFFFPPKVCPAEISVTTGQIVLKFGDMVDMDVQQGFKILNVGL